MFRTLKEVQPTGFLGVPRVWEKIHEKLKEVAATVTGTKKKISTWAKVPTCSSDISDISYD